MQPEWLRYRERGSVFGYRLIVRLALLLGRRVTRVLLYPICFYYLLFSRTTPRASRKYLAKALGRAPTWGEVFRHIVQFGLRSVPLIATSGFAIGVVLSMHTRASLERFGAEAMIPAGLAIALIRETGPLTAGLLVSGRVGAGIGAELGAISKVAKVGGDTMVTLKANGKTKTVPASSLSLSGGALVSSQTKADLWGPK